MDFSTSQIIATVAGSVTCLGGLISAAVLINKAVIERRNAREGRDRQNLKDSVEGRRLELEHGDKRESSIVENLWKIIGEKNEEIAGLEEDLAASSLSRKMVNKVYANIRAIRKEIDHLNLMILNEEETNVFMRRFQTVKQLLDDTENVLP